jgi:putative chitinase
MITVEQLQPIIPTNKHVDEWCHALNINLSNYTIDTSKRIASFLSQCAHESLDFTVLQENLNYSATALATTWPNRFAIKDSAGIPVKPYRSNALANEIERNPEKIANNVYANRMGNGDVSSGDGWKYRGSGLIQLTGHDNYKLFSEHKNISIDDCVDYVKTTEGAVEAACWFWKSHNINQWADKENIEMVTKTINGGLIGIEDRKKRYGKAIQLLSSL